MIMVKNRKHFVFEKDRCHPRYSKKYIKSSQHIVELFKNNSLKCGAFIISDLSDLIGKNAGIEFYLYPGEDFDEEDHDKFCKLIEEYPWEEFGISRPAGIYRPGRQEE